ncbi:MAG: radical SAM protein, partial [Lachnospiraceae bacterium]|nr:radical SAM protein [Lachnospiraceae bacterium]
MKKVMKEVPEIQIDKQITECLTDCCLCPRECHVNRLEGNIGYCKESARILLARAALHMWEEPCISGKEGSGAIFFTGCPVGCVFCQNADIAAGERGKMITPERLKCIFLELQEQGANNINLVTPTHYVPLIIWAVREARKEGLQIPIVYNTSGYEKVETIRQLNGIVDVYLPDMKYYDSALGAKYSNAADYFEKASAALQEMVRQLPTPAFDTRGIMQKGVIVRHLVLPGQKEDSKKIVRYLYETYHDSIYISLMNQYTPGKNL